MIVAGVGFRRGCPAEALLALLAEAGSVDILAAPAWKSVEPGLLEAARVFGRPLRFVDKAALAAVQPLCPTRSATAARAVGVASVAEAAALAHGGTLLRARFGNQWATCALAVSPYLLPQAGEEDGSIP